MFVIIPKNLTIVKGVKISYTAEMEQNRYAGILLHPISLPGPHGIGSLGEKVFSFIDTLAESHISLWQILPLSPTGIGNSPYAARSTFAGNELLIDLESIKTWGFLEEAGFADAPAFPDTRVDYDILIPWKMKLLRLSAERFIEGISGKENFMLQEYEKFCLEQEFWLQDYALFTVLTEAYGGNPGWHSYWDKDISLRETAALQKWKSRKSHEISIIMVMQFFFYTQWMKVKTYANSAGIQLVGDLPIFVSGDSADVWCHRELFKIDAEGQFSYISGVPPDNFSDTGQLWGTPVYDWDQNRAEGFDWWMRRIEHALHTTDIVRIDHFRGFQACWEVPGDELTAENGTWVTAPGQEIFDAARERLGEIPIIAEDLGIITPEVDNLRIQNGFPGMKVLQFAFEFDARGGLRGEHIYLPHNYPENCAAYTGTHDNETSQGWYDHQSPEMKDLIRRYLARPDNDMVWSLIRALFASHAAYVIVPFQDLFSLKNDARINTPATVGVHNWSWRMNEAQLRDFPVNRLREMTDLYGREGPFAVKTRNS